MRCKGLQGMAHSKIMVRDSRVLTQNEDVQLVTLSTALKDQGKPVFKMFP